MLNAVRCIFFTPNMPGMTAFYRDVLGLTVKQPRPGMEYDENEFIQFQAGAFEIALHRARYAGSDGEGGASKIVFHCDDVDAECERLSAKGVKFRVFKPTPGNPLRLADFKDPDGNVLQLSNR